MILGQYVPVDSPVHSLSARSKLPAAILAVATVLLCTTPTHFALAALFALITIRLAKLPLSYIIRGLRPLFILFVFTFVLHIFLTDGKTELWHWGLLSITREGVTGGLFLLARLTLIVVFTTLLTLTTSPLDLADGLESLLSPLRRVRFPVHEFALMMTIALRFIPLLVDEIEKIEAAQTARGADFSQGGPIKRVLNFLPILIPLFIISFRRADELALAMESRCYRGGDARTRYHDEPWKTADTTALTLIAAFTVVLAVGKFL